MAGDIIPTDFWAELRAATPARIGLGRRGDAPPLAAVLAFQEAHAKARDAVHAVFDTQAIAAAFPGHPVLEIKSAAADRTTYLRRPDLGRRLDAPSRARLEAASGTPCDVLFVISDGLSASAVRDHAVPFVKACLARLGPLRAGPVLVATQARVALSDEAGAILGARLCASVIGERPGLTVADSLGVYLTFDPRLGRHDSERNCLSNIHPNGGLTYAQAADKFIWLTRAALRLEATGVTLKDESNLALRLAPPMQAPG